MTTAKILTLRRPNNPPVVGEAPAHTIDRVSCLRRVRSALQLLYAVGDKIGSPKIRGAALDAMLAVRGLV